MSEMNYKEKTYSLESEKALIGALFLDNSKFDEVSNMVSADSFYYSRNKSIYEAMCQLRDLGSPLDIITVKNKLEQSGKLHEAGGIDYISELSGCVPTSSNIVAYAKVVREKYLSRKIIKMAYNIISEAGENDADTESLLAMAQQNVLSIESQNSIDDVVFIKDLVNPTISEIDRMDKLHGIAGIPTGFKKLDQMTTGLYGSQLIILAARPRMGKTALALNVAMNAAMSGGRSILIFSLEMSKIELVSRMICMVAKVNSQKYKSGIMGRDGRKLSDEEWVRIADATSVIDSLKIAIVDKQGLPQSKISSLARSFKRKHGLDMVIIDYLQLIGDERGKKNSNRENEVAMISRSMKGLAKELDIPVIALSQLNRDLEKRNDKRPIMSDIRESGAIEQDADVIAFIYRDSEYNQADGSTEKEAEIIVSKNRSGVCGTAKVCFEREYTLFYDWEENDYYRY